LEYHCLLLFCFGFLDASRWRVPLDSGHGLLESLRAPRTESMSTEYAFEMATSNIRFGVGATREVGMDLVDLGVRRALVVTDATLARLAPVQTVLSALETAGVESILFDRVRVEPTDGSFRDAIQFAAAHQPDGIVAVGGGSVIDTAKAVNLYTTYPPA